MKIHEVCKLVAEIIDASEDDSTLAHELEDELYADVLSAIADGDCDDPKALAREALKTQEVMIYRSY